MLMPAWPWCAFITNKSVSATGLITRSSCVCVGVYFCVIACAKTIALNVELEGAIPLGTQQSWGPR